jgi:hypothetical protein
LVRRGIQGVDIPVALHVGFTETERTAQGTGVETIAIELDIPGVAAVECDTGLGKEVGDCFLCQCSHGPLPCCRLWAGASRLETPDNSSKSVLKTCCFDPDVISLRFSPSTCRKYIAQSE